MTLERVFEEAGLQPIAVELITQTEPGEKLGKKMTALKNIATAHGLEVETILEGAKRKSLSWNLADPDNPYAAWHTVAAAAHRHDEIGPNSAALKGKLSDLQRQAEESRNANVRTRARVAVKLMRVVFAEELADFTR